MHVVRRIQFAHEKKDENVFTHNTEAGTYTSSRRFRDLYNKKLSMVMLDEDSSRLGARSAQQTAPRAALHYLLRNPIVAKWPTVAFHDTISNVSRHDN
jgi:hypothetical protein